MKKAFYLSAMICFLFSLGLQNAPKVAQYVGSQKCKLCHKNKERGDQYDIWENSPHARAFSVLATAEALETAKKIGLEGNPQQSAACLQCHVTAYEESAAVKDTTLSQEEGIGCEACHGPGSLYKTFTIMKALAAGKQDAKEVSFSLGDDQTCLKCHNTASPTYKPFQFEQFFKRISHPLPH
jgi:hypothetical protein